MAPAVGDVGLPTFGASDLELGPPATPARSNQLTAASMPNGASLIRKTCPVTETPEGSGTR